MATWVAPSCYHPTRSVPPQLSKSLCWLRSYLPMVDSRILQVWLGIVARVWPIPLRGNASPRAPCERRATVVLATVIAPAATPP
jgi:hypothetical protein